MTKETEADLETRVHHALRSVFPPLAVGDLRHQTWFSLQFGRNTLTIDGRAADRAGARSDVVVHYRGRPLAILELKRPGHPITEADVRQGCSYARLLQPPAPLVIITNGSETRWVESYSEQPWAGSDPSAAEVARIFEQAATVAAQDVRTAVQTLLGPDSTVWALAVRTATGQAIAALSGSMDDALSPFVPSMLFPREATDEVLQAMDDGRRIVLVDGPPAIGKSNLLGDFAERTRESSAYAVLYIDLQGGAGGGVLRSIARLLARELAWPASTDDVRLWLDRLSRDAGRDGVPALVLALDGVGSDAETARAELEEVDALLGRGLRLVATADEDAADRLVKRRSQWTQIGRRASRVRLEPLSDAEFDAANLVLLEHGFGVMAGAGHSEELRTPWVLRALVADSAPHRSEPTPEGRAVPVLPPMLGVEFTGVARRHLAEPELRVPLADFARAVLRETEDARRPVSLLLHAVVTFVARRRTVTQSVDRAELEMLLNRGIVRMVPGPDDDGVYVVRTPEMMVAALSQVLAEELGSRIASDAPAAADWLAARASRLPLGDVIAASAILDLSQRAVIPVSLIRRLLEQPPASTPLGPGRYAVLGPGGVEIEVRVRPDGAMVDAQTGGKQLHIASEEMAVDGGSIRENTYPWLILSHLAGLHMEAQREEPDRQEDVPSGSEIRVDAWLLLELGTCPFVLRRAPRGLQNPDSRTASVPTERLADGSEVAWHHGGLVEPITYALFRFLAAAGADAALWIDEAVRRGSIPLLMRVATALTVLGRSADRGQAAWAAATLQDSITPSLTNLVQSHRT